ncbi:MAG: BRO family protein [Pseudomonadota bacterium]|nr:BRO family protein [Pseudomonadota bacterium]
MSALLAYQFDEEPVRVIMLDGEPWFIANDLCRVLGINNARMALTRLDDDEKGVSSTDTLGGQQEMSIISESGMYALVLGSRKPDARRFRKWVTSEVLPALRRTGRYQLTELEPAPPQATDLDPPRMLAGVSVVREARRLYGPAAARSLWAQVGLPPVIADSEAVFDTDPLADPLQAALQGKMQITIAEAADAMGIRDLDWTTRHRIGRLLHLWGWSAKNEKVAKHRTARVFRRPESREGLA